MQSSYEVVLRIVTDADGLVSIQVVKTRDMTPIEEDEDDPNENGGD